MEKNRDELIRELEHLRREAAESQAQAQALHASLAEAEDKRQSAEQALKRAAAKARIYRAESEALLLGAHTILEDRGFLPTARTLFDICKAQTGATAGYIALVNEEGNENEVLFLDAGGAVVHGGPQPSHAYTGPQGVSFSFPADCV